MAEYANSPWNGLTVIDVRGPNGSTYFSVSNSDVNLTTVGNQSFLGNPGAQFGLRFEWIHTRQGAPVPTLVVIEFRNPDTGVQVGTVDWNPVPNSVNGVATRTAHFDTDPLDQVAGVSRTGQLYMHLYLEYKPGAEIEWWADSLGNRGGTNPLPVNFARGILDTVVIPTLDVQDHSDLEGTGTGRKDFNVPVLLSQPVATDLEFTYYTDDRSIYPRPNKILIAIMENTNYESIRGNTTDCPWINRFIGAGNRSANAAVFTDSHGVTHPSQGNYLALFSGSQNGVTDDTCPPPGTLPYVTQNMARQLIDKGRTFKTYSEGLPSAGSTTCSSGKYFRKHNPVTNWQGSGTNQVTGTTVNVAFSTFPSNPNYGNLPDVSYVVPNNDNNMHDGSEPARFVAGDDWLEANLDNYVTWCLTNNSLFILTWDEDDFRSQNKILTVMYGPMVQGGDYSTTINHYNVLRTIQEIYNITPNNNAATANPITNIWKAPYVSTPDAGITATVTTDFKSKRGWRTIPAGSTSAVARMEVEQDSVSENEEFFYCRVDNVVVPSTGAAHPQVTLGRNKATVTIIDDEGIPPPPPPPGTEGFMAGFLWSAMSTNPSGMDTYLDKKLPVERIYAVEWQTTVSSSVTTAMNQNRLVLWSMKPPQNSSGVRKWSKITDGSNDAGIDALGTALKNLGKEIVFIFHHEPHDDTTDLASGDTGTSTEFKNAFRRIHNRWVGKGILAKEDPNNNVWLGYCAGDGGSKGSHNPITGGTDPMYPGGDIIDVLCHDAYNWVTNNCRSDGWDSFQTTWTNYLKVAHVQRKKLIAGETGSFKGTGGNSRNQWFRDMSTWLQTGTIPANQGFPAEPVSKWFKGFCYFNRLHQDNCASEWRFVDQDSNGNTFDVDDGRVGWEQSVGAESFFVSVPFTLRDNFTSNCGTNYVRGPAREESTPNAGENSGLCASKKFPNTMWGVRDSGHPAELQRFKTTATEGVYTTRAITVSGATNSDWEDCVYADEGNGTFIYVMDTGKNPKQFIKIKEPTNPDTDTSTTTVATYHWQFPSNSESVCGPANNCEAFFFWPQPNGSASGTLYAILKRNSASWVYRIGHPSQLSTSSGSPTIGTFVGSIAHGCVSGFAVNTAGDMAASVRSGGSGDGELMIWKGDGLDVTSLLSGKAQKIADMSLPSTGGNTNQAGNFEAVTVFPWGSCNFQAGAESRLGYYVKAT